jgi:hypothetical protein
MKVDGSIDYAELRNLMNQKMSDRDLGLRYFTGKLLAKIEIEKRRDINHNEKQQKLADLKQNWFGLIRDKLCAELALNASRSVFPPWSVSCVHPTYEPKKIEDVMDDLWNNLGKFIDLPNETSSSDQHNSPQELFTSAPPSKPELQVGQVKELTKMFENGKGIGFYGKPNNPRQIGIKTTIARINGGKAYSRRLFSKPQTICTRGRKKSARQKKRTRQRR